VNLGQRHRQQLHVPRHDELPGHRQPDQEQLDAFLWGAEVRGHVWKWDGLKFRSPPYPHALPNLPVILILLGIGMAAADDGQLAGELALEPLDIFLAGPEATSREHEGGVPDLQQQHVRVIEQLHLEDAMDAGAEPVGGEAARRRNKRGGV